MDASVWSAQLLAEFIVAVSAAETEAAAAQAAVEHAAEALDADMAAIVGGGALVAAVGYPEGRVPVAELNAVRPGAAGTRIDVPGAGVCAATAATLEYPPGATLVLARSGPDGLSRQEVGQLRGMARVAAMAMRMLRVLEDERSAREELRTVADEQAALRRVAVLVARVAPPEEVFAAVATEVGQVLDANFTFLSRYDPDGGAVILAAWAKSGAAPVLRGGDRLELGGRNVHTLVLQTGLPARIDDYASASGPAAVAMRAAEMRAAVGVPVRVEGRLWGAILAGSTREPLPPATEARLAGFTELVATAIANAQARVELRGYAEEQAALRRVAVLVARAAPPQEVFAAVTEEVRRLLDGSDTDLMRYEPDGAVTILATSSSADTALPAARVELRGYAEEQAALRRVAVLVARAAPPEEVFAAVTEEVRRLLDGSDTDLMRYEPDGAVTILATSSSADTALPARVGTRASLGGRNVITLVFQTSQPARIDDYSGASGPVADIVRGWGLRSAVGAPISVAGRLWGVILAGSTRDPLPPATEARLAGFTELVATAIANAEAQAALAASRARVVATADATRRRIERDLHDGAQQRLVSLALQLRAAQSAAPPEARELAKQLDDVAAGLVSALEELREIARGIHPAILAEGGLRPALRALARRCAVPVRLDVQAEGRLPEPIEIAAYYAVSEALTNTAKHAHASAAEVEVSAGEGALHIRVHDDGRGGARFGQGSGLAGLKDRVEALGGRIWLHGPPGAGTTVQITLPLGAPGRAGLPAGVAGPPGEAGRDHAADPGSPGPAQGS
jgi:signal transduction histidine kinase